MTLNTMGSSVSTRLLHINADLLPWSERGGTPGCGRKTALRVCEGVPEGPRFSDT